MLVLRKEIKIGIGAGLTILGIAAVYGLIAALSGGSTDTANKQTAANVATDDSKKGLDKAVDGLPPVEPDAALVAIKTDGTVHDPFLESTRKDGNNTTDPWAAALTTGQTNGGAVKSPAVVKAPAEPKRDNRVIVDPLPGHEAEVARALQNGTAKINASAPVKTAASTTGGTKYVVKAGDTFSTIAKAHYGSKTAAAALLKANPDVDPKRLRPGKEINLPAKEEVATVGGSGSMGRPAGELSTPIDASRQYRIARGDTLSSISTKVYRTSTKWEELYEANKVTIGANPAALKPGTVIDLPQKPVR